LGIKYVCRVPFVTLVTKNQVLKPKQNCGILYALVMHLVEFSDVYLPNLQVFQEEWKIQMGVKKKENLRIMHGLMLQALVEYDEVRELFTALRIVFRQIEKIFEYFKHRMCGINLICLKDDDARNTIKTFLK
jgi:hypothetical protein